MRGRSRDKAKSKKMREITVERRSKKERGETKMRKGGWQSWREREKYI